MKNLTKKNPYFSNTGLTSSEANFICERIKERLKPIVYEVSNINTHTVTVDGEAFDSNQRVDNIEEKLKEIAELYSVSAYLRTAIKEKEQRLNAIKKQIEKVKVQAQEDIAKEEMGDEFVNNPALFDYLAIKPQEEAFEYLNASEYAELLERNIKTIDIVRKNIKSAKLFDAEFLRGKVVEKKPLYTEEELEEILLELRSEKTKYDNIVNRMLGDYYEYRDGCIRKYTAENDRINNEYNEKLETEVSSKKAEYIKMKEQVANYRIVVPHKYKELIAELSSK